MTKLDLIPSARVLRNVLIIMWSCLVVYLIIKLLGGNWFEIACQNERFINLCNYVDNNFIPRYFVSLFTSLILYAFLYLAILRQWAFTKIQFIMYAVYIPVQCLIKNFFMDNLIVNLFFLLLSDFLFPVVLYLTTKNKITWKFIIFNLLISVGVVYAMQFISLFIKNIGVKMLDDNSLITIIYGIDVFLMEIIYYLYANKLHQERSN